MNLMITGYLHTGLTVQDLNQAIQMYERVGYVVTKQFERPDLNARAAQIKLLDNNVLELWEFAHEDHPQIQFIKHHVALGSNSLEEDTKKLVEAGYRLVIPITQGAILRYAYLQDPSDNCLEIAQI